MLLDFGYTPDALSTTSSCSAANPKKIEALIVSHGHFDHFGGLIGFLDKYRDALPADLTLYAGGEDNFCIASGPRRARCPTSARSTAASSRKRNVKTVLAETPRDRRPCLHHRQDHAPQHREGAAATPASSTP